MVKGGPGWSMKVKGGHVWSSVVNFGQFWSKLVYRVVKGGQRCSRLISLTFGISISFTESHSAPLGMIPKNSNITC